MKRKALFVVSVKTVARDILGNLGVTIFGSLTEKVIQDAKELYCESLRSQDIACTSDQCVVLNVIFLEA